MVDPPDAERIEVPRPRLSERFTFLRPDSAVLIYVGIAVIAIGFALIGLTWGWVAGLLDVALQLPYVVSGGLTGVGLIVIGATLIAVATKRRDAAEQHAQLDQLAEIMTELRAALEDQRRKRR